jgi:hypothetical protein
MPGKTSISSPCSRGSPSSRKRAVELFYLDLVAEDLLLVESDAGDFFDPVLVVGHPHVDSGQVGVGTLDTVAHCPHQYPPIINQCVIII